jgi:hypothetical protein
MGVFVNWMVNGDDVNAVHWILSSCLPAFS